MVRLNKRIVCVLIILLVVMGCWACANSKEVVTTGKENQKELQGVEVKKEKTLGVSSKKIAENILGRSSDCFSLEEDGYIVEVFRNEKEFAYFITYENEKFPSVVYLYNKEFKATDKNKDVLFNAISSLDIDLDNVEIQNYEFEKDGGRVVVGYCLAKESGAGSCAVDIGMRPEQDFFMTMDEERYGQLARSGQYDVLYNEVTKYIAENNPPDYDNAYYLLEYLTPIMEQWNELVIQYDDFEEKGRIYYKNVEEISETTHIVPYVATNKKGVEVEIGCIGSDWIFFDKVEISGSPDNVKIYNSKSGDREVLDDARVYEWISTDLREEECEHIQKSDERTIRFKNTSNGKYVDYTISEDEVLSISILQSLNEMPRKIEDLCHSFWHF